MDLHLAKIKPYLLRVTSASPTELIYRLRRTATGLHLRYRHFKWLPPPSPPLIDSSSAVKELVLPPLMPKVTAETVDTVLCQQRFTLAIPLDRIIAFEKRYKREFLPSVTNHSEGVDIRSVWEAARLQHIMLLLAYCQQQPSSGKIEDIQVFVRNEIQQWITDNPFGCGPHYLSPMECGLRIPVFVYCLKTIDIWSAKDRQSLLDVIYQHAWWIYRNLALYSSRGNHTVCECLGLIFAGLLYGSSKEGQQWLHRGRSIMEKEALFQIVGDGGPREQSFNYHRFVLDLFWLAHNILYSNGGGLGNATLNRLQSGDNFLFQVGGKKDEPANIGDSDDGYALAPGLAPRRPTPAEGASWVQQFKSSGYTVFRCRSGMRLIFDHGPLGMAPLFNHGHADALSIVLSLDGLQLLVDPGTYRYNGVPSWRRYFKGTRAHNTVTIDDQDQAIQESGFIWSRPYTASLLNSHIENEFTIVKAMHDGYHRFSEPLAHQRAICVHSSGDCIIKDDFLGKGNHSYELNFHLHPEAQVTSENGWWQIKRGDVGICMRIIGTDTRLHKATDSDTFGWYSPAYGVKRPSKVLTTRRYGSPDQVSFSTQIQVQPVKCDDNHYGA